VVGIEDEPWVRLPPHIEFDLAEAATLLFALDAARNIVEPESRTGVTIRRAIRLVTGKLWPALGDLLDEE
jgi:hypothetical protein